MQGGRQAPTSGSRGIITGASGFIGRAVVRQLPPDAEVYATYHADDSFPEFAAGCAATVHPVRLDLAHEQLTSRVPHVDWAILCAARVEVAASWEDPVAEIGRAAAIAVNSVRGLPADRIVHVSSGAVYEGLDGPLSAERVLAPRAPYAIAKIVSERLLATYAQSPWWNLRFFGAYGPGEPSFKLIRRTIEALVSGQRSFELTGDGTNRLDPMHVDDAARCLLAAAGTPPEDRTVDVCQGESRTVDEFLRLASEAAGASDDGSTIEIRYHGSAHERVLGVPDASDALATFGVMLRSTLDGLRDYVAAVRAQPHQE